MPTTDLPDTPDEALDDIDDIAVDDELEADVFEEDVDDDVEEEEEEETTEALDETAEALEELEDEELQLLEDEVSEALLVDEVQELRAMRRAELTIDVDAQEPKEDEFVCQLCFMVKRTTQLANKRKMLCKDCVA
ncbi:MAG: hypothetical protein ACE5F5_06365 [Acidimicrobiia bacterium]